MNVERKRFIAGAKCPKCKALDSIMLYTQDNVEKLECVMCDYTESQDNQKTPSTNQESDSVIGFFKPE
ncbi:MAG: YheV family putative metal-binding protein [Enterobacterales bacterium]|nr:YheV family putative metal-binding protein [Enterobacterales bacterium]